MYPAVGRASPTGSRCSRSVGALGWDLAGRSVPTRSAPLPEESGRAWPPVACSIASLCRDGMRSMLDLDLIAPEVPRRLTRAEYDQIVALGLLGDDRVELLQGVIVAMSPNDPPHASPVELLTEILVSALVGRARVRIQLPFVAADDSEPEPDVAVVPLPDYSPNHPDPSDLILPVPHPPPPPH